MPTDPPGRVERFLDRWKTWVPILVVLLSGAGITLVVSDDDGDGTPDKVIVKRVPAAPPAIAVDGPDKDVKPDDAIPLDTEAQEHLEDLAEQDDGELQQKLREPGDGPAITAEPGTPLAAQEFPGCRTAFVGNSSSRRGSRPAVITWHQTVSHDHPGRSDQDALTAMADRLSSGVSWHFLIGGVDGLCTFSVPLDLKAWTQANANPVAFGIEVQAFGDEPTYVQSKGARKLLAVTRELGRRFDIPMRRGLVRFDADCDPVVVISGIVEHSDLGPCGGGHIDVTSTSRPDPWQAQVDRLIVRARTGDCGPRCQRQRDLRERHGDTHRRLTSRRCGPPARTRSTRCRFLWSRNRALHAAARREGLKL